MASPQLQVTVKPTTALSSPVPITLNVYLHDKQLGCGGPAGLAGQATVDISGPTNVVITIDPNAQQMGRTCDQMIKPQYYLSVESDGLQTTGIEGYGDGAPYFNVDISKPLEVNLTKK
mmetsp:Transcript_2930/g.6412  ORF Transcript_2930/g.6412 Transcript_2930/m.6412 type:complete len:118 (-) Transcript_2930:449-802(-)|eukprot:CAMPEP_0202900190 /NCGR_PEP_ID=MMETSP1392-20130828/10321_1 /ASSEMBLY_ACC=CAM_ASM_000868 /TAXON_ID=225041 /ORGANISM="Chlamydomonas chlamydogama, Strain SAG 11-48b" /LENGTH=117 /DNA_ID=CAMNT_0049586529 /DNA_START=135 /DNA_END=488 /DNA_ORIENTATION=+